MTWLVKTDTYADEAGQRCELTRGYVGIVRQSGSVDAILADSHNERGSLGRIKVDRTSNTIDVCIASRTRALADCRRHRE